MIDGVTCHMLPHLPGVPHLHVNRPLVLQLVAVSGSCGGQMVCLFLIPIE